MSKPSFQSDDICCPTCNTGDTVRLLSKISDTQFESVIWCAEGHITYLDRHDRETHLINTFNTRNVIKAIKK